MKTLILSANDVKSVLNIGTVMEAVEEAFRAHGRNETLMPPKIYLSLQLEKFEGDFRAMSAYIGRSAGVKWVNVHPQNTKEKNLPTVMAVIIFSDPQTGFPLAIMDGTQITNYRTGASGGVAAKYLAKKDSKTLGLIGCGVQAKTQLLALALCFSFEKIYLYDINQQTSDKFISEFPNYKMEKASIEKVASCDIVCTTTPSRKPLLKKEWLSKGAHINAIGADAPGKQELDPAILKNAKVVVDDITQASHSGEINVPIHEDKFKKEDIYGTLGEIVAGLKKGREKDEITVFDSTGLAIQDIAVARIIFEEATKRKLGTEVDIIGLGR